MTVTSLHMGATASRERVSMWKGCGEWGGDLKIKKQNKIKHPLWDITHILTLRQGSFEVWKKKNQSKKKKGEFDLQLV